MTAATLSATERLRLYRQSHRIEVDRSPDWTRCDHDGIRIHLTLARRWFHDLSELRKLEQEAAREDLDRGVVTFPSPEEIARAEAIARESAAMFAAVEAEADYFRAHEDDGPDAACLETGHARSCTCALGSDPILVVAVGGSEYEIEWVD